MYISLSGGLSNTYSSSVLAIANLKEEYGNVHIECEACIGGKAAQQK